MHIVTFFIVFIVLIGLLVFSIDFVKDEIHLNLGFTPLSNLSGQQTGTSAGSQGTTGQNAGYNNSSNTLPLLNTAITTPQNGAVFYDTNEVSIEFTGNVTPETEGTITFETQIQGTETSWQSTSGNSRTIRLPAAGSNGYTILVRSRLQNYVDPTPASVTFYTNASPYLGKLSISQVKSSNPGYIQLQTNLQQGETINITKWKLEGRSKEYAIEKGLKQYTGLSSVPLENIILQQGDSVYISESTNPLRANYKTNKCFGYLRLETTFPFSTPSSCPEGELITFEQISQYSASCQDFLRAIPRCTVSDYSNNAIVQNDLQCRIFIDQLKDQRSYEYCAQHHGTDSDFSQSGAWHIYATDNFMRDTHDQIVLRDSNGFFVDKEVY